MAGESEIIPITHRVDLHFPCNLNKDLQLLFCVSCFVSCFFRGDRANESNKYV